MSTSTEIDRVIKGSYFWALWSFQMFTGPLFHVYIYKVLSVDFKNPWELWNPLKKAVPGKFHESVGHSKHTTCSNCLEDWANFPRSRVWQIVLILTLRCSQHYFLIHEFAFFISCQNVLVTWHRFLLSISDIFHLITFSFRHIFIGLLFLTSAIGKFTLDFCCEAYICCYISGCILLLFLSQ